MLEEKEAKILNINPDTEKIELTFNVQEVEDNNADESETSENNAVDAE